MRIGIVGAGHIGGTLARKFAEVGHEVIVANSRGPHTLRDLVDELGGRGRAATAIEAEELGDVVVVSVPFGKYDAIPADGIAGKTLIDTCNYYPDRDGHFDDLDADATTSSEMVQEHFRGAHVVKAFNSIRWGHLRDNGRPAGDPERLAIPISGDDERAKRTVAALIDQIGFDAVDAGDLAHGGRRHQPGSPVYGADLHADQLRDQLR